jgi:hypothetical protein
VACRAVLTTYAYASIALMCLVRSRLSFPAGRNLPVGIESGPAREPGEELERWEKVGKK